MWKCAKRSICHDRPKQYPLMLTGHNSLIHWAFWLSSNPSPYLLPIPAVLHPPSASMIS